MCPAGNYEIMTEEEPIGDFTYAVYRRVSTTIYVPRAAGEIGLGEIIETDPAELSEYVLKVPDSIRSSRMSTPNECSSFSPPPRKCSLSRGLHRLDALGVSFQ
jgi:hypothetical protein